MPPNWHRDSRATTSSPFGLTCGCFSPKVLGDYKRARRVIVTGAGQNRSRATWLLQLFSHSFSSAFCCQSFFFSVSVSPSQSLAQQSSSSSALNSPPVSRRFARNHAPPQEGALGHSGHAPSAGHDCPDQQRGERQLQGLQSPGWRARQAPTSWLEWTR